MLPFVDKNMPLQLTFKQDNDPKHTSKLIKSLFNTSKITVMQRPVG